MEKILTKKELWSRSYVYGTVICTYASRKIAVYATELLNLIYNTKTLPTKDIAKVPRHGFLA